MKEYYITFRSVTLAQRAERLVSRGGWRCSLGRTPRWMEQQGCGYALHIRCGEIEAVAALLKAQPLPIRRVWQRREDGNLEEVAL